MRVLLVDFEADWRGGQSQALLLLKGLRQRKHTAELIAVPSSGLSGARDSGKYPGPFSWQFRAEVKWCAFAAASVAKSGVSTLCTLTTRMHLQRHGLRRHLSLCADGCGNDVWRFPSPAGGWRFRGIGPRREPLLSPMLCEPNCWQQI